LEYVEFDPHVNPKNIWNPTAVTEKFLECQIMRRKQLPRPNCKALLTPKVREAQEESSE
jgi:hypothetical protein